MLLPAQLMNSAIVWAEMGVVSEIPASAERLKGPREAEVDLVRQALGPLRGPWPWPPAVA